MQSSAQSSRLKAWQWIAGLVLFSISFFWAFQSHPIRALWPSIVALGLVLLWRRVLLGLVAGGLAGCVILAEGNPLVAVKLLLVDYFLPIWQSEWKLGALAFTLILGGMASLIEQSGGLQSLLKWFVQRSEGDAKRRIEWGAYLLGLICFFDGLANSMLVGRLMKNLASRSGVSGVKLAYIVDSTSSAVACLAVISTWIAYQLAMIREGYDQIGQEVDAYALFISSIPFNFYCWFTLGLLALVIAKRFWIGPMKAFEQAAEQVTDTTSVEIEAGGRIATAVVPLCVLIVSLLVGLYVSGSETIWPVTFKKLSEAYGQADAAKVLVICSLLASVMALIYMPTRFKFTQRLSVFASGAATLFAPVLVLIGAWILGGTMQSLGTAEVIAGFLSEELPVALLPVVVFLCGAAISFFTGTSWGTMGILMPLSIPVAYTMTSGQPGELMPAVVAAVFSGAVFGDHCSPISDTTLVSSIAVGVRPEDHVRTQMPYAVLAAIAAVLFGFIPAGLGMPGWLGLIIGLIALWVLTKLYRKSNTV